MPRINLTSVFVDDLPKALSFYTDILGFEKCEDFQFGEARWLTVVSPVDPGGVRLVLEPDTNPAVAQYKHALYRDGIPFLSFGVPSVYDEYTRLSALGVRFAQMPASLGPIQKAVIDDTCGNLIQLASPA
jgi:catechol 2,3-dioxygenase-like lactoylglutathione lyase family enzyme